MIETLDSSTIYNKIAPVYTQLIETRAPVDDIHRFLSLVTQGGKILDAGCAAGRDTRFFKKEGFQPTGVDASKEMIHTAATTSPEIPFVQSDLKKLPFDDASFDGIWSSATLDHLDRLDLPGALSELGRVLKPNGIMYVSIRSGEGELKTADKFSQGLERRFTLVGKDEFEGMLQNAGFQVSMIYDAPSTSRPELMSFLHTLSVKNSE
jgi:ubiquinone/menaquinone biosynthesis C-methylase UbiE